MEFRCGSRVVDFNGNTGAHEVVQLPLTIFNNDPQAQMVGGCTVIIEAETAELELVGLTPGSDLALIRGGAGPQVFLVNDCGGSTPSRSAKILGMVTDFTLVELIDPTSPFEIALLEVVGNGLSGNTSSVTRSVLWTDQAACMPVVLANDWVNAEGDQALPQCLVSGTICFQPTLPVAFLRGDVDENGAVSIGDPMALLLLLFGGSAITTECEAACDVNGDSQLGLGDPIYLLAFLFVGGPDPVVPFGGCGPDPISGPLECLHFDACP